MVISIINDLGTFASSLKDCYYTWVHLFDDGHYIEVCPLINVCHEFFMRCKVVILIHIILGGNGFIGLVARSHFVLIVHCSWTYSCW